jgi:hypothetical protein
MTVMFILGSFGYIGNDGDMIYPDMHSTSLSKTSMVEDVDARRWMTRWIKHLALPRWRATTGGPISGRKHPIVTVTISPLIHLITCTHNTPQSICDRISISAQT